MPSLPSLATGFCSLEAWKSELPRFRGLELRVSGLFAVVFCFCFFFFGGGGGGSGLRR